MNKNPMREALDGWEDMQSALMTANDQVRELTSCNAQLLSEVDYLRQEMERVKLERDRYQRYSVEISTRLSGIKETILMAEGASREFALKPPVPSAPEMPAGEVDEIRSLASRLAPNSYQ